MKRLYDEENYTMDEDDDEFSGYSIDDEVSIYKTIAAATEPEQETEATPIPQNEQTVILFEAQTAGLSDGKELKLHFSGNECTVYFGSKKVGILKSAYVIKLKAERGGQKVKAYYKADVPPMVRLVFGNEGEYIK